MKLKSVRSDHEVSVNVARYMIDWDAKCRSKYQWEIKQWLRQYWHHHICLEEFLLPGSRLRCDFVNLTRKAIIEMNGVQHDKYNKHFHRGSRLNFMSQVTRDQIKRDWANANGFVLIEIQPSDLPLTTTFFKEKYNLEIL